MTFTNTSQYTITDLVYPQPFMGVAVGTRTNYAGGTWSDSEGVWLWSDGVAAYENPAEPHPDVYVVSMRVPPTDPAVPSTASDFQARELWSGYSPYVASTFVWPRGAATSVADTDSIPVYSLSASAVAPGESTAVSFTIWREKNTAYYGYGSPDILVGTVSCP